MKGNHLCFIIPLFMLMAFGMIVLPSCNRSKTVENSALFENNSWYYGKRIIFKGDSAISYANYDTVAKKPTERVAFPIHLTDTSLIYTRYKQQGVYNDDRNFVVTHCEKYADTVLYDFKYINKKPKLILYLEPFPLILSTKKSIDLPETNNFSPIKFVISDYSIGDQIDRSLLKTRGIYNYPHYTIEDCEYMENKDITFKIIGYNTIYSIERRRIEDYRIKEIVKVVSNKLNTQPEYRPMKKWMDDADYEYEFYRWDVNGVQINLSRSKYIGNEVYKTLVGNNDWILSYDDAFLQAILVERYRNGMPQSSIIN